MSDPKKDNIVDLTQARVIAPPRSSIVKPATSVDVDALRFNLAQLENNTSAAPLAIPVGKPGEFEWFRTHADPQYRPTFLCIDFEPPGTGSKELHIIHPTMAHFFVTTSAHPHKLYVLMNRVGNVRVVPVKLAGHDGKQNEWHRTRQLALEKGNAQWVRMNTNKPAGRYEWHPAPTEFPDPIWPDLTIGEILQIAFGDLGRIIDKVEHPVIQVLRGNI
jgi:hypothetical protein